MFTTTKTKEELVEALKLAHKLDIPYFVLAGGSNVVFPDTGFRGLVVRYVADKIDVTSPLTEGRLRGERKIILPPHLTSPLAGEEFGGYPLRAGEELGCAPRAREKTLVGVEAGMMLGEMVRSLLKQGLGGFNFLANIPGSVGGAIVGNAGCYGKEMKDVLEEIEIFDVKTGKIINMKPSELGFDYRHSKLKHQPELIVLSAVLKITKVNPKQALKEIMEEKQTRLDKHPQSPSCGSWFKNPERGIPAWKFIDQAGLRGHTIGGARISNKHSNFLVNCGGATAKDVVKLSQFVQQKVKAKTGIALESEACVIS